MDLAAHDVTARDGTTLRVWAVSPPDAGEAVLFLHGGITASRALFAPPVPGDDSYSWLHAAADRGRAAFALSVRGYGESDPLPAYDEPPGANDPPIRAVDAARDVADAVAFVRERHDTVHLVGYSWGTMTGGCYLADGGDVASFTAGAPVYRSPVEFEDALAGLGLEPGFGAWAVEERETVLARQDPDEMALFDGVWDVQAGSNQGVEGEDAYRFQTGTLLDVRDACADDPVYDAAAIEVPTLVIRGSADPTSQREDALSLYDELGADEAEYAELSGSHFVPHGPRRRALYGAVDAFQGRAAA